MANIYIPVPTISIEVEKDWPNDRCRGVIFIQLETKGALDETNLEATRVWAGAWRDIYVNDGYEDEEAKMDAYNHFARRLTEILA